jgi:hypothetical protein
MIVKSYFLGVDHNKYLFANSKEISVALKNEALYEFSAFRQKNNCSIH